MFYVLWGAFHILCIYDKQGNCTEKSVWQIDNQAATTCRHYNSDGTLAWQKDPLGYTYTWQYGHAHIKRSEKRDPLGRNSVEEEDAFHRLVKRDLIANGKLQATTHFTYDRMGHLVKQNAHVMQEGTFLREYSVLRRYNCRGFLESETEHPHGKTTYYTYDNKGQLKQKIKPDGICLNYTYDALD